MYRRKSSEEILPYSLAHQQNHDRCKELYPAGFKYIGGGLRSNFQNRNSAIKYLKV